jgi:hypothetical protein
MHLKVKFSTVKLPHTNCSHRFCVWNKVNSDKGVEDNFELLRENNRWLGSFLLMLLLVNAPIVKYTEFRVLNLMHQPQWVITLALFEDGLF